MLSALAACGGGDEAPKASAKLAVVTTLAPIDEAVRRVGGDAVTVTNITPVGGQPHELQPSAAAETAMRSAKLVVTIGPFFQPAVSAAVNELPGTVERLDLLGSTDLLRPAKPIRGMRGTVVGAVDGDSDPHLWVSPKRFIASVEAIRDALVKADPSRKAAYEQRASAYVQELGVLDAQFSASLGKCDSKVLLTTHPAFAYLAADYGLTQAVTAGISVAARPDPASLAAVKDYASSKNVETLFFAAPVPSRLAKTVKSGTGLASATLNPVEGLTQDQIDGGRTYLTLMRENLQALVDGLGCEPTAVGQSAPGTTSGSTPATTPGA